MKFPDKLYDFLKWMVLVCIPAATTFYGALDETFKWGYKEVVFAISAATCAFIGMLIGVSTIKYNKEIK